MWNHRHENNHKAALKYLAANAYKKSVEARVALRVRIALALVSLGLAGLIHFFIGGVG